MSIAQNRRYLVRKNVALVPSIYDETSGQAVDFANFSIKTSPENESKILLTEQWMLDAIKNGILPTIMGDSLDISVPIHNVDGSFSFEIFVKRANGQIKKSYLVTIPKAKDGIDGKTGAGIQIKGTVATNNLLPTNANDGDAYFSNEDNKIHIKTGQGWISFTGIQGEPGKVYIPTEDGFNAVGARVIIFRATGLPDIRITIPKGDKGDKGDTADLTSITNYQAVEEVDFKTEVENALVKNWVNLNTTTLPPYVSDPSKIFLINDSLILRPIFNKHEYAGFFSFFDTTDNTFKIETYKAIPLQNLIDVRRINLKTNLPISIASENVNIINIKEWK